MIGAWMGRWVVNLLVGVLDACPFTDLFISAARPPVGHHTESHMDTGTPGAVTAVAEVGDATAAAPDAPSMPATTAPADEGTPDTGDVHTEEAKGADATAVHQALEQTAKQLAEREIEVEALRAQIAAHGRNQAVTATRPMVSVAAAAEQTAATVAAQALLLSKQAEEAAALKEQVAEQKAVTAALKARLDKQEAQQAKAVRPPYVAVAAAAATSAGKTMIARHVSDVVMNGQQLAEAAIAAARRERKTAAPAAFMDTPEPPQQRRRTAGMYAVSASGAGYDGGPSEDDLQWAKATPDFPVLG